MKKFTLFHRLFLLCALGIGVLLTVVHTSGTRPISMLARTGITRDVSQQPRGIDIHMAFDTSQSWRRSGLGASVTLMGQLATRLDPGCHLHMYRTDWQLHPFFDNSLPESGEKLQWIIYEEVRRAPSQPRTLPHLLWNHLAGQVAQTKRPFVVIFCTDGDADLRTPAIQHQIRRAARALANPLCIGVYIYGPKASNWAALQQDLAPLYQKNLLKRFPASDMDIEPLCTAIEQARMGRPPRADASF